MLSKEGGLLATLILKGDLTMKNIGIALLLIAVLSAGIIIGCSDDKSSEEVLCDSLSELNVAVQNVNSITIGTSIDQAQEYQDQLQSAWEDTANAAEDVAYDKWDEVKAAYDDLISSLDSISGETTIQQALPSIQAALNEFRTSLEEMESVECNSTDKQ